MRVTAFRLHHFGSGLGSLGSGYSVSVNGVNVVEFEPWLIVALYRAWRAVRAGEASHEQ